MDIMFTKWNMDFGFRKLIETCEACVSEIYPEFCSRYIKAQGFKFLDTLIISNIVIFSLFLGLYCDFYHLPRFRPYQYFAKTNNDVLSKKSWN